MRKIAIFVVLLIVMMLAACGRDGDARPEPQIYYEAEYEAMPEAVAEPVHEVAALDNDPAADFVKKLLNVISVYAFDEDLPPSTGRIFMFGEIHGSEATINRQLEIWGDFYTNYGMRHLFLETSYFQAQLLNLWMQADDDIILLQLFEDWRGSAAHNPYSLAFYRAIKAYYPETIFHGTDVGHQSGSAGRRFLRMLTVNDLQNTESYRLASESIEQFRRFQRERSHTVRAYYKPRNFIREFDRLGDQDVMAIHGMAHVEIGDFWGYVGVPSMATTLRERYGDNLYTFDMTHYALTRDPHDPYRIDIITVAGIDFEAAYFGRDNASFTIADGRTLAGREFWRLENAYDYFRDNPLTGNVMPFDNFPMSIETGQVFVADIHFTDGTTVRQFFRASGHYWNNRPTTQEFIP